MTERPGRVLRRLGAADADALLAILHAAYAADLELGVRFGASDATRDDVLAHLRGNLAHGLVDPAAPERILSTISIRVPWGPNPGPLALPHLGWLAADPACPERGLGSEVLERIEDVLREQLRAPAVTLGTAREHPWLGDYYVRRGYERIGSRDLGLGHLTDYHLKPLDPAAFETWRAAHVSDLEGIAR